MLRLDKPRSVSSNRDASAYLLRSRRLCRIKLQFDAPVICLQGDLTTFDGRKSPTVEYVPFIEPKGIRLGATAKEGAVVSIIDEYAR